MMNGIQNMNDVIVHITSDCPMFRLPGFSGLPAPMRALPANGVQTMDSHAPPMMMATTKPVMEGVCALGRLRVVSQDPR